MRVCQVLPELKVGGVETGTVDFAKYLVEHGHHSVVISNGGRLVDDLENNGSVHYTIPVHKKSFLSLWPCIKAVREVINKEKIQIVHARSRIPALIAYFACQGTNAEFITTCHGYYSNHFFSSVMGWAKRVIVVSEIIGRHMIETFKVPAENIRLIPRSVDVSKFTEQHQREEGQSNFTIVNIGRLTPIKGHKYFLEAMAKVVRSMPYVKIWIVGDAPESKKDYREELEMLVKRLGLVNHVEFLGNRSNIPEILAQSDVLVLSSIVPESFGRVLIEAHAAGVPPITTNIGGSVDVVEHEKTGLLVEPKNADEMAQAVIRLLNDPKLCEEMVAEGQRRIQQKYLLEHMCGATLKVYKELIDSLHILVIKVGAIGDVTLVTASLKALRNKYPRAKLSCLVGREASVVLQGCPYIDQIIVFDHKQKDANVWGFLRILKKIRREKFDKVIDFQNNEKSHLFAWLSGARELYGYNNKKLGFLLNRGIKNDQPLLPPVEHQFRVLNELDIKYDDSVRLEMWPSQSDEKYVKELLESEWLDSAHKIIGINLAASERWTTKNWPLEYVAELCDLLAQENVRLVLTGMDKDREAAAKVQALSKAKVADFTGKTNVMQLATLIDKCRVYITPDSAPMHFAAAMNVPFVCFFGPTDSARHIPPATRYHILKRDLPCAPCYSTTCRIETHDCMKHITVDEVYQTVKGMIE